MQGHYDRARQHYEHVLQVEPDNEMLLQNLAKLQRAAQSQRHATQTQGHATQTQRHATQTQRHVTHTQGHATQTQGQATQTQRPRNTDP